MAQRALSDQADDRQHERQQGDDQQEQYQGRFQNYFFQSFQLKPTRNVRPFCGMES